MLYVRLLLIYGVDVKEKTDAEISQDICCVLDVAHKSADVYSQAPNLLV